MSLRRAGLRFAVAGAAVLGGATLAGCGNVSADLFFATRDGTVPGAHLTLRVTDDGRVSCNHGALRDVTSKQLIDARVLVNDLKKPAKAALSLRPGRGSVFTYTIDTMNGAVHFSDTSAHQPPVFFRAAFLVRQIAEGPCGLQT